MVKLFKLTNVNIIAANASQLALSVRELIYRKYGQCFSRVTNMSNENCYNKLFYYIQNAGSSIVLRGHRAFWVRIQNYISQQMKAALPQY